MDNQPEINTATESSDELLDSAQPVQPSQLLDVPNSISTSEPVQAQTLSPDESDEFFDEYHYRSVVGDHDSEIHHWNWFGQPVYEPTTTPPAVSLAFMQARPKAPKGRDRLRVTSIMNRAILQIDPVILKVDRGNEAILEMHGSAMIQACDGLSYIHYSLHGNWINDDFSMRRMTVPDAGWPVAREWAIGDEELVVGNGIVDNGPLISRYEWMDWRDKLVAATKEPALSPRKLTWQPSPSKFKIESTSSKRPSPPNHLPTYSSAPLEIVSKDTHKARVTTEKIPLTSTSFPVGITATIIKKAWPAPKTIPGPKAIPDTMTIPHAPFSLQLTITSQLIKKAWATASKVLHKSFAFPLSILRTIMKKLWALIKAVLNPRRFVSELLSLTSN